MQLLIATKFYLFEVRCQLVEPTTRSRKVEEMLNSVYNMFVIKSLHTAKIFSFQQFFCFFLLNAIYFVISTVNFISISFRTMQIWSHILIQVIALNAKSMNFQTCEKMIVRFTVYAFKTRNWRRVLRRLNN